MSDQNKLKKLKTDTFSRSFSLAKLGIKAGVKYAGAKLTNASLDNYFNSQAVQFVSELGKLKGSAMKAGQLLSVYGEHFLPPEANKILKNLQSDSSVLSWEVMYEQLLCEFPSDALDKLEINTDPIGSASMGQVYQAMVKATGKKLALKIQYPGVDKAIDSDVAALKRILSISKILPDGLNTDGLFNEIKTMLHQELNYELEAQYTLAFRELLAGDNRFKVPEIFPEFCSRKVLATEFMEGLRPDHELVQSLSQERRNSIGLNFLDLFFKELFVWNHLQSDPHLGNYKIQLGSKPGEDVIVLLDFGATKKFTAEFITAYRKMIKGAVTKDDKMFFSGAEGLGFIKPSDTEEYIAAFHRFCRQAVEPFSEPGSDFNWKENDLPKRVIKNAFEFRRFELRTPPQELVFLDRKTAGVFMFLSALRSRFSALEVITPYLESL
jgi:predicted unusual protein kinase regulating ubiquinone biosynthesis (AarF/ABC1/UbiB family)